MISAVEFTETAASMPDHVQHVVLLHVSGAGGTGQRYPSIWVNMLVLGHHVGNYCVVVRLDRTCSWHLSDMVQISALHKYLHVFLLSEQIVQGQNIKHLDIMHV